MGPLRSKMRTASITVSAGRMVMARSVSRLPKSLWMALRLVISPIRFFIPRVSVAMPWFLAMGTLISASALKTSS